MMRSFTTSLLFLLTSSLCCTTPALAKYGGGGAGNGGIPITSTGGKIAVSVVMVLGVILVIYGIRVGMNRKKKFTAEFEQKMIEAQQTVGRSCQEHPEPPSSGLAPTNGNYPFRYMYGKSKTLDGDVNLVFEKTSQGWAIRGEGQDHHGAFKIVDGRVSHGGAAWWIYEGREAKRTLAHGAFIFSTNSFEGTWTQTGNGMNGDYESFRLQSAYGGV
jgi:hypothetical protein